MSKENTKIKGEEGLEFILQFVPFCPGKILLRFFWGVTGIGSKRKISTIALQITKKILAENVTYLHSVQRGGHKVAAFASVNLLQFADLF